MDRSVIAALFQNQDYTRLSKLAIEHKDVVGSYIQSNPRQYLKTIPILRTNPDMSGFFDGWMLFQGYEQGLIVKDFVCKAVRIVWFKQNYILLNWPELKSTRPLLARKYPETLEYSEEELVRLRRLPGFGDEVVAAIAEDSVIQLKKCMADPNFDMEKYGFVILSKAIIWDSIECFHFLMINGANRDNTMRFAVGCGRREMIELLEQDGQGFKGAFSQAVYNFENEIAEWLVDTGRVTNLVDAIVGMQNIRNIPFYNQLLSRQDPPQTLASLVHSHFNKLLFQIIDIAEYDPTILEPCLAKMIQKQCRCFVLGCLKHIPFDGSLLTDQILSRLRDKINIATASTIEALQFCLTRIPKHKLKMSDTTPTILQALRDKTIRPEDVDWTAAADTLTGITQLFEAGVSFSQRFENGRTVMHSLVRYGSEFFESFQFALDHGADPFARDDSGTTPLDLARSWNWPYIDLFPPNTTICSVSSSI